VNLPLCLRINCDGKFGGERWKRSSIHATLIPWQ